MRRDVAAFGRWSFLAGWLIAGGITTLFERGHLWSFWPTAALGLAIVIGGHVAAGLVGARLVRRWEAEP